MKLVVECVINVRGMTRRKSSTAACATASATAHLASKLGMYTICISHGEHGLAQVSKG
jgi:hypothetical protein